jgi:hypothetical protein
MALVHSRISRVIYGIPRKNGGGLGGGMHNGNFKVNSNNAPIYVHNLPGINHHYRVFCCNPKSELYEECNKLHPF